MSRVTRELLKIFYFIALFVCLCFVGMQLLLRTGAAERIGIDNAKHAGCLASLVTTFGAAYLWSAWRRRRSQL